MSRRVIVKNALKGFDNTLPDDFFDKEVSKIGSLVGRIKNVTIEGTIEEKEVVEFDGGVMMRCEVDDGTGKMSAIVGGAISDEIKRLVNCVDIGCRVRMFGHVMLNDEMPNGRVLVVMKISEI